MHSGNQSYMNIGDNRQQSHGHHEETPWYWRMVALTASWMIVAGFLLLPGLYAINPQLKFSTAVLSVFVVALLTAGYSFTALLCFACRDPSFQAYNVFLPTLASSALGLISIVFNLFATRAYQWANASTAGAIISGTATLTYGSLFLWRTHRIYMSRRPQSPPTSWSNPTFYDNYNINMYPTATARSPSRAPETTAYIPLNPDEAVTQQMQILLNHRDPAPSPNATSTYKITLPVDAEQERRDAEQERRERSQELVGTPELVYTDASRGRADSRPDSLGEQQAWERLHERGRTAARPASTGARSGHERGLSREERRREIEMGRLS